MKLDAADSPAQSDSGRYQDYKQLASSKTNDTCASQNTVREVEQQNCLLVKMKWQSAAQANFLVQMRVLVMWAGM